MSTRTFTLEDLRKPLLATIREQNRKAKQERLEGIFYMVYGCSKHLRFRHGCSLFQPQRSLAEAIEYMNNDAMFKFWSVGKELEPLYLCVLVCSYIKTESKDHFHYEMVAEGYSDEYNVYYRLC